MPTKPAHINRLIKKDRASASTVDNRGSTKKQVVATSGKLRFAMIKENKDGQRNN